MQSLTFKTIRKVLATLLMGLLVLPPRLYSDQATRPYYPYGPDSLFGQFIISVPQDLKESLGKVSEGWKSIMVEENPHKEFDKRLKQFQTELDDHNSSYNLGIWAALPATRASWKKLEKIAVESHVKSDLRMGEAMDRIGADYAKLDAVEAWVKNSSKIFARFEVTHAALISEIEALSVQVGIDAAARDEIKTILSHANQWMRTSQGLYATTSASDLSYQMAARSLVVIQEIKKALQHVRDNPGAPLDLSAPQAKSASVFDESMFANTPQGARDHEVLEKIKSSLPVSDLPAQVAQTVQGTLERSLVVASHSESISQRQQLYGAVTLTIASRDAYIQGDHESGNQLLSGALTAFDVGIGFVPIAGAVNDLAQIAYGLVTGKTYTGEKFTAGEFGLRALGTVLGLVGVGGFIKLGKLGKMGGAFENGARLLNSAEKQAEISKTLTQSGKESYQNLAEFIGRLYQAGPAHGEATSSALVNAAKALRDSSGGFSAEKLAKLTREVGVTEWTGAYVRKVMKLEEMPFSSIDEVLESVETYNKVAIQMGKVEKATYTDQKLIRLIQKEYIDPETGKKVVLGVEDVFKRHPGVFAGGSRFSLPGNGGVYSIMEDGLESYRTLADEVGQLPLPTSLPISPNMLWPGHLLGSKVVTSGKVLDLTNDHALKILGVSGTDLIHDIKKSASAYNLTRIFGDVAKRHGFEAIVTKSSKNEARSRVWFHLGDFK